MRDTTFQTVRLSKGRHTSPAEGACVIELASMLAGEPFNDHPRSVCPVVAAFLRAYNDKVSACDRRALYPYAAMVVGSAAPGARKQRARLLMEWVKVQRRLARIGVHLRQWDLVAAPAAQAAVELDPERREIEVAMLLESLLAVGRADGACATDAPGGVHVSSPSPSPSPSGSALADLTRIR
jgi:hypothetical protein